MSTAAVAERNAAIVERFYESERRRDLETWASLWHPAGRQTFPFSKESEVRGINDLRRVTARKFEVRPPYEIHTRVEAFADPHRVLARLRLVMTVPAGAEVNIWCVFHFDDDGRVLEVEEMLDTASAPPVPQ
ncbi:nuclear transport factor 2 family protein [Agromyces albus]|uniref:nuclear transport factor 2 family protein n=1 Tax=Agromyces albus TaxID=205332 RepID=UPI0013E92135|nr:nuclear transport factor 2 family protein [Agromyces albus]